MPNQSPEPTAAAASVCNRSRRSAVAQLSTLGRLRIMKNPKALMAVIAILTVALFTSLGFLVRGVWRDFMWKQEVVGLVGQVVLYRGTADYQAGKLRLFVIDGENEHERYSGTNDGPFQIWVAQYYPSLGYSDRFITEQMVSLYNSRMRAMYEHPEKYFPKTSISSQTNTP